jgi:dihydroneopterin aldolase
MSKIEVPRFASATSGVRHVFIRNLELSAHIGVYRQEEGRTQPVRINVDLATDDIADAQDMLENVVDYHVIEKRIRAIIAEGHVRWRKPWPNGSPLPVSRMPGCAPCGSGLRNWPP